jgi:hypothetical protein
MYSESFLGRSFWLDGGFFLERRGRQHGAVGFVHDD